MFECATPVCLWFGTQYIIQVRDDGTIPNRETDIPTLRAYPAMPEYLKAVAQRTIEDIKYKGRHMTDKEIQEEIDRETDSR